MISEGKEKQVEISRGRILVCVLKGSGKNLFDFIKPQELL